MTVAILPRYAELHCVSNFSFLHGASHPEELVVRSLELGYAALAITDECSLAGVVRAHAEAKHSGLHLIVGSSFVLEDGLELVLLAIDREGYGNLSELITLGRMRAPKGCYRLTRADFDGTPQPADRIPACSGTIDHLAGVPNCIALWIPDRDADDDTLDADARWFSRTFPCRAKPPDAKPSFVSQRTWIALRNTQRMDDKEVMGRWVALGARMGLPCTATGHVQMHVRSRKPLHDTMTAIRLGLPVSDCGDALTPNAERHLRSRVRLPNLFASEHLEASVTIAEQCGFSLIELGYEYPREIVPEGETQTSHLRNLTEEGLLRRYPDGVVPKVRQQIEHELALIADLGYEAFFLTVEDIVRHARSVGILCQGRGSAANSAVCYSLGITEVNPALQDMLFERFLTKERNEPPDIDVDFEHQRREEVIQYIFDKYGRHRTALAATVIAYRTRSAIRDVGRALGFDGERIDRLAASHAFWDGSQESRARLEENGFDPDSPIVQKLLELTGTLRSFPRHLSQHVGGFVISADKLSRMVPTENAAMRKPKDWDDASGRRTIDAGRGTVFPGTASPGHDSPATPGCSASQPDPRAVALPRPEPSVVAQCPSNDVDRRPMATAARREPRAASTLFPTFRSVIQWDKDDLEELGLLKVDVLALGMLSAMRRALEMIGQRRGRVFTMSDVPSEDAETYDMICRADTVGVFQVESRAQMSMLPRLLPRTYYDLVVEVAIVRPGPIQGGMVHPYLKAREAVRNNVPIVYPKPAVEKALARTLGVPIFQEQVMQLMMLAADFSAGEADKLRRAMAAWKRKGGLGPFQNRIVEGMIRNGYEREYAERIFKQVEGFGEYGFPESHAASFAFLVYLSCWIKCHHPAVFLAAMINSQPLGFYSSSQLIQDAQRHRVRVRPIDVTISGWDTVLEEDGVLVGGTGASLEPAATDGSVERDPGVPTDAPASDTKDPAVRLGFNSINGFNLQASSRILMARQERPFESVDDLGRRALLSTLELDALAAADALTSLAGHRRQARWHAASHRLQHDLMREAPIEETPPTLPRAAEAREIGDDYSSTGFSLRRHPLALLRARLRAMRLQSAAELESIPDGQLVRTTGIVTLRQQPGTAKGVIFVSLEDETGVVNVIVWKRVSKAQRTPLLGARLLTVYGVLQRKGDVSHVVAHHLRDDSALVGGLALSSRDFH